MSRIGFAAVLLFASGCAVGDHAAPAPKPPNLVVFLVDDLGWQDLSEPFATSRTPWNDRYVTPNVERLCREGMKFPQAYAHQVCSPSRVSLMTGMAAARHKVTHWTLQPDTPTDPERNGLVRPDWNVNGLSLEPGVPRTVCAETLPERLQAVGYHSIHVGKAHFGAVGMPGEDPRHLGFDVNIAGHAAGAPSSYLAENGFLRNAGDTVWQVPGLERYHGQHRFLTDILTDEAIAAADVARQRGQPFYLYLAHYAVHAPYDPDDRFVQKYRDRGLPEPEARYAAMIEGIDDSLGRVLRWLDEHGMTDDTIVVFASDNGGLSTGPRAGEKHVQNAPLRSGKGSAYEGGIRVPFAMRWPGHVAEHVVSNLPVQLEDLMPTLCELVASTGTPADGHCPDGKSFAKVALGAQAASAAHPLFFHSPHYWGSQGPGIEPYSAVRDGDYKLIWFYDGGRMELYDVVHDVGETANLVERMPEVAARLRKLLHAQLADCEAQVPTRKDGKAVARP